MRDSGDDDLTHTHDPLDVAFYRTVHGYKGGAPALAKVIGMKPGVLQNKADPNMDHEPTLKQTRSVMLASRDFRVLDVLAQDCGHVAIEVEKFKPTGDVGLLQQYLAIDQARGELAKAIHQALSNKKLTKRQIEEIKAVAQHEVAELEGMIARLDACRDDKT